MHETISQDAQNTAALNPNSVWAALASGIDKPSTLPEGIEVAQIEVLVDTSLGEGAAGTAVGGTVAATGETGAAAVATDTAAAASRGGTTEPIPASAPTQEPPAATEEIGPAEEITRIIGKANETTGNDGDIASNEKVAEDAAEQFVGDNARPIHDRQGNYAGEISADGTRVARYTSANDPDDPYINLENKTTGGNLHLRWIK